MIGESPQGATAVTDQCDQDILTEVHDLSPVGLMAIIAASITHSHGDFRRDIDDQLFNIKHTESLRTIRGHNRVLHWNDASQHHRLVVAGFILTALIFTPGVNRASGAKIRRMIAALRCKSATSWRIVPFSSDSYFRTHYKDAKQREFCLLPRIFFAFPEREFFTP